MTERDPIATLTQDASLALILSVTLVREYGSHGEAAAVEQTFIRHASTILQRGGSTESDLPVLATAVTLLDMVSMSEARNTASTKIESMLKSGIRTSAGRAVDRLFGASNGPFAQAALDLADFAVTFVNGQGLSLDDCDVLPQPEVLERSVSNGLRAAMTPG